MKSTAYVLVWIALFAILCPSHALAMECKATTIFKLGRVVQQIGTLSASATDEDPYPQRLFSTVDVGIFGIRVYAFADNTSPAGSGVTTRFSEGVLRLDNVVFASAGSDPIVVSLNVDVDGQLSLASL